MGSDLDFRLTFPVGFVFPFGEPGVYPGGISYGTIRLNAAGTFQTDGNRTTLEVINVMLGSGNDHLNVVSTMVPGPDLGLVVTGAVVTATSITRPVGRTWTQDGFAVGQRVAIDDLPGLWTITSITNGGRTLNLSGAALTAGTRTITVGVVALHGGITAIHGGGNSLLQIGGTFDVLADRIIRRDGLSWAAAGFEKGQQITLSGALAGTYAVLGFAGSSYGAGSALLLGGLPLATATNVAATATVTDQLAAVGSISFAQFHGRNGIVRTDGQAWWNVGFAIGQRVYIEGVGTRTVIGFDNSSASADGDVLLVDGAPIATSPAAARTVAVTSRYTATGVFTAVNGAGSSTLTRTTGSWLTDGFTIGTPVAITGVTGTRVITAISSDGKTLTLTGGTLPAGPLSRTVAALRIGGDTITVTGGTSTTAAGGPDSPLVVYGDTSQDGIWYGGDPTVISLQNFGPKPMPHEDAINVTLTPGGTITRTDGGSWISSGFAVGQRIAINDVYVGVVTTVTDSVITLTFIEPAYSAFTSGVRKVSVQNRIGNGAPFFVFPQAHSYQWAGNDVIDARGAFSAVPSSSLPTVGITAYGGPGNDTIYGTQTGDHLAGGSGDDVIVGGRGQDHVYGDSGVNVDFITRALTIPTSNTSAELNHDDLVAGKDLLFGDSAGTTTSGTLGANDDIVFGDHGEIVQNVQGPRDVSKPVPAGLQKIQTTTIDSLVSMRSREPQNGADDTIYGNSDRDLLVGGTGSDFIDGGVEDDIVFGDNVELVRTANTESGRFQTLGGTLLYSRSDLTVGTNAGQQRRAAGQRDASGLPGHRLRHPVVGVLRCHRPLPHRGDGRRQRRPRQLRQRLPRRWTGRRPDLRPARQRRDPGRFLDRLRVLPGRAAHQRDVRLQRRRPPGRCVAYAGWLRHRCSRDGV